MGEPFQPSRPSGQSDGRVLADLAESTEEDHLTFEEMIEALRSELPDDRAAKIDKGRVYRAVTAANKLLLRERNRILINQRGRGYRLTDPSEHHLVAQSRQVRASVQIKKGISLLRDTDVTTMDPEIRKLHEGQYHIMSGIYALAEDAAERATRAEARFEVAEDRHQETQAETEARLKLIEAKLAAYDP